MRDFGTYNVVVRNIRRAILNNEIESIEQLDNILSNIVEVLNINEYKLKEALMKKLDCKHEEFNPTTYTYQRRLIDYAYVYKRSCSNCGFTETFTISNEDKGEKEMPGWTDNAIKQFYNNDI